MDSIEIEKKKFYELQTINEANEIIFFNSAERKNKKQYLSQEI